MAKRQRQNDRRATRGNGWEFIPAPSRVVGPTKKRSKSDAPADQKIRVREEKRKDKAVTVARGFRLNEKDQKALAKKLKQGCSAGGTSSEDTIEIQGRHRDKVIALLEKAGYQAQQG